jgi:hypothetical protein
VVAHDWRAVARKLAEEALPDTRTTRLIHDKALDLTLDLDGDNFVDDDEVTNPVAKARAIYEWVNTNFPTQGDTSNAHQALKAGAGDRCKLFIALCTSVGVKLAFAYADASPPYKQPTSEDLARPHWAHVRTEDFTEFLVCVFDEAGDATWIELGDRLRPFGRLGARLNRAPAILWSDGRYELIHLPGVGAEVDRFENRTTIELNADGSASLKGSMTIRGERSYGLKEALRNVPLEQLRRQVQGQLAQAYRGVQVSECSFPNLADIGEPFTQEFEGSVKRLARAAGDALTLDLPGEKTFDLIGVLAGSERRRFDISMPFDFIQKDELRIKPPKGYAFSAIPDGLLCPTAPLEYSLQFRLEAGELVMTRKVIIGPGRLRAAEYAGVVEQIKQIRAAEAVKLKLVKAE